MIGEAAEEYYSTKLTAISSEGDVRCFQQKPIGNDILS